MVCRTGVCEGEGGWCGMEGGCDVREIASDGVAEKVV